MYFSKVLTIILAIILALFGIYGKSEKRGDFCVANFYCQKIKNSGIYFKSRLTTSLPPIHSALADGILFGDDSRLPKEVKKQFREVGLSHITAASGSNVSLIIIPLVSILSLLPIKKHWRTMIIVLCLIWYAVVSGLDPPIIRATILAAATLLSLIFNLYLNTRNLILLTATVMLLFNPVLLRENLGFQLSFAALIGIIYGGEYVKRLNLKKEWQNTFASYAGPTFFAFLFTAPIILYISGKISLISIPLNLLAAPLIPLIMIFGLLVIIWPPLASGALWLCLNLLISMTQFASEHNLLINVKISYFVVALLYFILLFLLLPLWWPNYHKNF